jgi:hypothetical protein
MNTLKARVYYYVHFRLEFLPHADTKSLYYKHQLLNAMHKNNPHGILSLEAVVDKTQVNWYMTPTRLVHLSSKTKSISNLVVT